MDIFRPLAQSRVSRGAEALRPVDVLRRGRAMATPGGGAAVRMLWRDTAGTVVRRELGLTLLRRPRLRTGSDLSFDLDGLLRAAGFFRWDGLAVRCNVRDKPRFVIAVVRHGCVAAVLKVGRRNDPKLANEAAWLAALDGGARPVRVPRLLEFAEMGHWQAIVMEPAPARPRIRRLNLREMLDVSVQLRWLCDGAGVTHGDPSVNNILGKMPSYWVVDWESAGEYRAGIDLAKFVLFDPRVDATTTRRLLSADSSLLRALAASTSHSVEEIYDSIIDWARHHRPAATVLRLLPESEAAPEGPD